MSLKDEINELLREQGLAPGTTTCPTCSGTGALRGMTGQVDPALVCPTCRGAKAVPLPEGIALPVCRECKMPIQIGLPYAEWTLRLRTSGSEAEPHSTDTSAVCMRCIIGKVTGRKVTER